MNIESGKLKFVCEMFGIWKFENKNVWIGMCEYLKLKTKIWNLYVKCLEFEILKIEMFEFGCDNTKSWKLKTKIWNIFVKCLEGISQFRN